MNKIWMLAIATALVSCAADSGSVLEPDLTYRHSRDGGKGDGDGPLQIVSATVSSSWNPKVEVVLRGRQTAAAGIVYNARSASGASTTA